MQHVETFCYRVAKRVKYVSRHNVKARVWADHVIYFALIVLCYFRKYFFLVE